MSTTKDRGVLPTPTGVRSWLLKEPEMNKADLEQYDWKIVDGEWVYAPKDGTGVPMTAEGLPIIPTQDKPLTGYAQE